MSHHFVRDISAVAACVAVLVSCASLPSGHAPARCGGALAANSPLERAVRETMDPRDASLAGYRHQFGLDTVRPSDVRVVRDERVCARVLAVLNDAKGPEIAAATQVVVIAVGDWLYISPDGSIGRGYYTLRRDYTQLGAVVGT